MSSVAFAERNPANNRSVVSNEPRRLSASVDMRSPDGRLFADCYDILAVEFPDADPLKVREVAVLKFAAEKAVASGAWEDVVRLHNLAARKEAPLRAAKRAMRVALPGPQAPASAPDLSQLSDAQLDRLYALLSEESQRESAAEALRMDAEARLPREATYPPKLKRPSVASVGPLMGEAGEGLAQVLQDYRIEKLVKLGTRLRLGVSWRPLSLRLACRRIRFARRTRFSSQSMSEWRASVKSAASRSRSGRLTLHRWLHGAHGGACGMTLSAQKLRAVINMLSDPGSAANAARVLTQEARERSKTCNRPRSLTHPLLSSRKIPNARNARCAPTGASVPTRHRCKSISPGKRPPKRLRSPPTGVRRFRDDEPGR
jgi:hypothetical protein